MISSYMLIGHAHILVFTKITGRIESKSWVLVILLPAFKYEALVVLQTAQ